MPTIRWEVEDGYAGSARPQETIIPDEEWDACETNKERWDLLHEYVQWDFDMNIGWGVINTDELFEES